MRFCSFISGGGTTMEQFLLSCRDGILHGLVEPALVIASKDGIGGIKKADDLGISVEVCPRGKLSLSEYGAVLLSLLSRFRVEVIAQMGWLPLTPVEVIREYDKRIWNQHPAPLDTGYPDFGGKGMHGRRAHCARLYYSRSTKLPEDQFTEATAHYVTERFDEGAVIGRTKVEILQSDDVISMADRVLPVEHALQIEIARQFATGTVEIQLRAERLIKPGNEALLEESKRVAGLLFPKG